MTKRLRVAVVGYGTGGQASALMLSADGHDVEVFERAPLLGPVGAGFLLQPVGLEVLWQLDLLDAALRLGAPVARLYGETSRGRAVMDMRYRELDQRLFGLGMQRGALFGLLDAAWQAGRQIHCGCEISSVDPDQGTLVDSSGKRFSGYDLIVIADGAASRLRGRLVKAQLDRPYPWGAQWCLVEQGNWRWGDELQQRYVGARNMVGMLPVGIRPGDPTPRLSFFWSVPVLSLDSAGPDAARQREDIARIWPEAAERLHGTQIPGGLANARYRDTVHRHWHRGRAVLLGDAAHAMSPQLGQGVNMALLDAQCLRDSLRSATSTDEALAAYQRERRDHVGIYHFWSRWLTPLFQSECDVAAAARDILFHPVSRIPGGRGQTLWILTGTRRGWLRRYPLRHAFLDALGPALIKRDAGPAPCAEVGVA